MSYPILQMPLPQGTRISHYEILALAGSGGMGEVYRARDTGLKRDAALKILPSAFARDPERMARFQREAEILASLNHPGIATIYGLVTDGETRAIAMEFVEGPTLACPQPLETAIEYAQQIAEALEYAHDRNVMHRDLKPANVKITPEGRVKLLDFGLAKAIEDPSPGVDPSNSPTLTLGHTRAGMIMGTAAYMSPEQAVGKSTDRRSDIFSFGAVLYEMLTGRAAFTGGSTPEILASVVKDEPDWSKLPPGSPATLIRPCLHKDRKLRLQAIGEARISLTDPDVGQVANLRPIANRPDWAASTIAIVIAALALWALLRPRPAEPKLVTRYTIPVPAPTTNTLALPTLSRDGTLMAYLGGDTTSIQLRRMDQFETRPVPGTEGASFAPCFSPDGQWIAFSAEMGRLVKKERISGGGALTLASGLDGADFCDWGDDGNIDFGTNPGILRGPASGGKAETVVAVDPKKNEIDFENPQLLPGNKLLLYTVITTKGFNEPSVGLFNLETHQTRIVLENAGAPSYAPAGADASHGYLLYGRGGSLFAALLDLKRETAGAPSPVLEGVSALLGFGLFRISNSGTLVYFSGEASAGVLGASAPVWTDRQGAEQSLSVRPAFIGLGLRLSPDGVRISFDIFDAQTATPDVWIHDVSRATTSRFTFAAANYNAVWTPDGKHLIYASSTSLTNRDSLLKSGPVGGSSQPVIILPADGDWTRYPTSISADGKNLLLMQSRTANATAFDIATLALDGSQQSKPQNFIATQFNERGAMFSPDGHWVVYVSDESGKDQVFVVPYPGPGGKWQISTDGGDWPQWNRNGRELFYRNGNKMMAVDVETGASFRAGTPKMLFDKLYQQGYDVAPDGKRFVMLKLAAPPPGKQNDLHVVLNWFEELRQRAR